MLLPPVCTQTHARCSRLRVVAVVVHGKHLLILPSSLSGVIPDPLGWSGVNERTFIAVKPDGVQRKLVGEILRRFEKRGFKLVGLKLVQASEDVLREHYWDLRSKPFFQGLMSYMSSGPIVVWEGLDVVKTARKMLGETKPADSLPGTIRGDFCVEVGRNVIHGSDSVPSAQKEISLWFRQDELHCWEDSSSHWIYD
ncbi:nucleoside diphosphate kinase 3 isoform X2 [Anarrhichthys ocellatus]|uniref:nucleoside diphosphate kinase 3 isoform X2 n=1 Tax=Anarrhichthys ocellatus TaxID=433405 RepID=UPI0012EE9C6A|nr:nucleoside diphosphate kinase 3 isoform X2 [Anarrhichthys ocellatus]